MSDKPAVSLVAVPRQRRATIDLAKRIEQEDFTGIYCPSPFDGLGLCEALALVTKEIPIGTTISHIYTRHPVDYAQTAALVHELSGGRFTFGIGVSHAPSHERLGITTGKPLDDIRSFVTAVRSSDQMAGGLPPIVLATLRQGMVRLAGEIADGAVWANAARSHMQASLRHLPEARRNDPSFLIGNLVPTCIDSDHAAAAAAMRQALSFYVRLPNYQNYWIEAGYTEEMEAIRKAIAAGEADRIPSLMSDRWLRDVTLFGSMAEVRDGVDAWREAGVRTVVLVPSSTRGNQLGAFAELFHAFR
jgi:alkanesulfonate monooxygenase SsuD/methylene tetrahydromethanopterin reductase-like flavin-dependent oxidoreductase (luciferase family)